MDLCAGDSRHVKVSSLSDLDIRVSKARLTKPRKINPHLFQLCNTIVWCGMRGMGKTTSMISLYKDYLNRQGGQFEPGFDREHVYMINPSYWNDPKVQQMNVEEHNVYTNPTDESVVEIVGKIKDEIEEYKEFEKYEKAWSRFLKAKNMADMDPLDLLLLYENGFQPPDPEKYPFGMPSSLMFLDDVAATDLLKQGKSPLNNFFIKHRHENCSVWIATQYIKALPRIIRNNVCVFCLFATKDGKLLKEIYQEISGIVKEADFYKFYEFATKEPNDFLTIDVVGKKNRFRRNFKDVLSIDGGRVAQSEDETT